MSKDKKARLIGYLPYEENNFVGFMLPIFSYGNERGNYIQIVDDIVGRIREFKRFGDGEELSVVCTSGMAVRRGDFPIFVFIDSLGEILSGSIFELSAKLEIVLKRGGIPISVALQIAELLNKEDLVQTYRARVASQIAMLSRNQNSVSSFFESAASMRIGKSADGDIVSPDYNSAGYIDRIINDGVKLTDRFREREPARSRSQTTVLAVEAHPYRVNVAQIEFHEDKKLQSVVFAGPWYRNSAVAYSDNGIIYDSARTIFLFGSASANTVLYSSRGFDARAMLYEIISIKRQEERIARLLSFILLGNHFWELVLTGYYYDHGQFARSSLGLIKRMLLSEKRSQPRIREFEIISIIDMLLKNAMMETRSRFLLGAARYMGRDPDVKLLITRFMHRNSPRSLYKYQSEIAHYLD